MAVNYSLYSVRDRRSTFTDPVSMVTDGVAIRNFRELLSSIKDSSPDDVMVPYTDLELYKLGSIDLVTGIISPIMPELLATSSLIDFGGDSVEE